MIFSEEHFQPELTRSAINVAVAHGWTSVPGDLAVELSNWSSNGRRYKKQAYVALDEFLEEQIDTPEQGGLTVAAASNTAQWAVENRRQWRREILVDNLEYLQRKNNGEAKDLGLIVPGGESSARMSALAAYKFGRITRGELENQYPDLKDSRERGEQSNDSLTRLTLGMISVAEFEQIQPWRREQKEREQERLHKQIAKLQAEHDSWENYEILTRREGPVMSYTNYRDAEMAAFLQQNFRGNSFSGEALPRGISAGRLQGFDLDRLLHDILSFDGDNIVYVVWSRSTPIGWITRDGWAYVVEQKFSQTTTRQQNVLRRAWGHLLNGPQPQSVALRHRRRPIPVAQRKARDPLDYNPPTEDDFVTHPTDGHYDTAASPDTSQEYFLDLIARIDDEVTA